MDTTPPLTLGSLRSHVSLFRQECEPRNLGRFGGIAGVRATTMIPIGSRHVASSRTLSLARCALVVWYVYVRKRSSCDAVDSIYMLTFR